MRDTFKGPSPGLVHNELMSNSLPEVIFLLSN